MIAGRGWAWLRLKLGKSETSEDDWGLAKLMVLNWTPQPAFLIRQPQLGRCCLSSSDVHAPSTQVAQERVQSLEP
jgi:hypothetical protein